MTEASEPKTPTLVTSESLSMSSRVACWVLALALLVSGGVATFTEKPGAAATAMIALGGLFTVVALMGRIPLRLEVAGATLDASYPTPDQAYDAGHDGGVREGLEAAVKEAKALEGSAGYSWARLVEELESVELARSPTVNSIRVKLVKAKDAASTESELRSRGWRGPSACNAAGVTYRQLDYWARTGLIEPSGTIDSTKPGTSEHLYTLDDISQLVAIRRLLEAGVSLQQVRHLMMRIRDRATSWERTTIVSDGESVYEVTRPDELADLLGSGRAHFAVSLAAVRDEVRTTLSQLPSEPLGQ